MKSDVHPKYYQATIKCACGNTFVTGSTKELIETDICSSCHPFYTGEQKYVDVQGRVEKFLARRQKASQTAKNKKDKKETEIKTNAEPKSLKEMLTAVKKTN